MGLSIFGGEIGPGKFEFFMTEFQHAEPSNPMGTFDRRLERTTWSVVIRYIDLFMKGFLKLKQPFRK